MAFDGKTRLQDWHALIESKDSSRLGDFLADDIEFYSPVFWKPKRGKMAAFIILSTVIQVFEGFAYERQWLNGREWALEFRAQVRGLAVKGVDLMTFDDEGKIVRFEVLLRPQNGLQALGEEMGQRLAAMGITH